MMLAVMELKGRFTPYHTSVLLLFIIIIIIISCRHVCVSVSLVISRVLEVIPGAPCPPSESVCSDVTVSSTNVGVLILSNTFAVLLQTGKT